MREKVILLDPISSGMEIASTLDAMGIPYLAVATVSAAAENGPLGSFLPAHGQFRDMLSWRPTGRCPGTNANWSAPAGTKAR